MVKFYSHKIVQTFVTFPKLRKSFLSCISCMERLPFSTLYIYYLARFHIMNAVFYEWRIHNYHIPMIHMLRSLHILSLSLLLLLLLLLWLLILIILLSFTKGEQNDAIYIHKGAFPISICHFSVWISPFLLFFAFIYCIQISVVHL